MLTGTGEKLPYGFIKRNDSLVSCLCRFEKTEILLHVFNFLFASRCLFNFIA